MVIVLINSVILKLNLSTLLVTVVCYAHEFCYCHDYFYACLLPFAPD